MIFKFINLLDKWLEKATSHVLVVTILVMLLFSVFSIIIRFFNFSFLWIEPFVRHLVFLSIFLGGIVATGKGTHIGIDIIGKYLEGRGLLAVKNFISFISNTISFLTLFWLSYASIAFIKVEQEFGKEVFFGIHSSFLVMIIPVGFSLIAVRFMVASLNYFNSKKTSKDQGVQHA